jgi:iron complex outermembrane receptor protein
VRAAYKRQGLPGSITAPSQAAQLSTTDVVGDGAFDAGVGAATAHHAAYLLVERQHLGDPRGELGLGSEDRDFLTLAGGASSTWRAAIGPHRGAAGVELRAERFRDRDASGAQPVLVGNRLAAAVTAAFDAVIDPPEARLVVTPAVRLDLVRTAPTPMTSGPSALVPVAPRRDTVASPRLNARLAATDDMAVKGSAGWYVRLPTLTEVFGDRGFLLGSPELRAERGPSADLGAVWAPAAPLGDVDRIFVELGGFAHRAHDTIALINSAGFVARAANLGDTDAYGGELVVSARYARLLGVTASYTRLVTSQHSSDPSLDGQAVPRQPGHALYARGELAHRVLGRDAALWLDTAWQSMSTIDPGGRSRVPGRALLGAGARVELVRGLGVALVVANLADIRIVQRPLDPPPSPSLTEAPTPLTDVAGFPLPGRSFDLSLDWTY